MKIKDVMTKDIISIAPDAGIRQICDIFQQNGFGGVPVVDKDNRILGIVTKNELLAVILPDYLGMIEDFLFIDDFGALEEELENLPELKLFLAEDLMVRDVTTIDAEASLLKAPVLMHKNNVRHLPVVKDGKLVGVITRGDILRALIGRGK